MKNNNKNENAYKTIGEVASEINLVDKNTGQLQTHTIRYWETQFKQVKPIIKAGGRRYYTKENLKLLKFIKFLLKEKGLTINGVKKILNTEGVHSLDDDLNLGVYNPSQKTTKAIKDKAKNISKIIKELKDITNG
tara:strand:+ start:735 stop:1139 length:405 start_codon:yes stop_codon:yes gene_type:complete